MSKIIILVHGLGGTPQGTWGNFPKYLIDDEYIPHSIITYGYSSPHIILGFLERAPSIANIANGLLTDIRNRCDINNDEIILVGHSLGGLVIRHLLLRLKISNVKHNIGKVCFFDVPHDGSGYANIGKLLSFRNRHLRSLCRDSSELDILNEQWVDSGLINDFDILSVVCANDDIVSSNSAKSIYRNHPIETINDVNHRSIVKPKSVNDISYIVLKNFILSKSTVSKLQNTASKGYVEWKRTDHRAHNLGFFADEKRQGDLKSIIDTLSGSPTILRISGASGLGKTRTLIEALERLKFRDNEILVFNATQNEKEARDAVRSVAGKDIHGILIVEDCAAELHNVFIRELNDIECKAFVITMGFFHDSVNESRHIKLSPLSLETIKNLLKSVITNIDDYQLDNFAQFFQGYPLMVALLSKFYASGQQFTGYITEREIVKRLISGTEPPSDIDHNILKACALFDVFGMDEGEPRVQAEFIAENIAKTSISEFKRVINKFTKRQIVNRAGRFARLVPKPLAITLASEWWEDSDYEDQVSLLLKMPASLIVAFGTQLKYLDEQPNVQKFSEKLSLHSGPFWKAEVLFTEKGSRFFRILVELNPEATSNLLYHLLVEMDKEQILELDGGVRRNLVWALEKLCFHATVFEKSAAALLMLSAGENETYGNNSTGIFTQLFRVSNSGTAANPEQRFNLLLQAINKNDPVIDFVIIKALAEAISTYGGARTIGAEYQGTKPPIEEWAPKIWQDIFDYWDNAFELLFKLFERTEGQREKVVSVIGHEIRGLFSNGRVELLDKAIRKIVSENGRYWPEGLDAIKTICEHDSGNLKPEAKEYLDSWIEILSPKNGDIAEQLMVLVVNPPWENKVNEDGKYVDVARESAEKLAVDIASTIDTLYPHLPLLVNGNQKQAYAFGRQLIISITDYARLFEMSLTAFYEAETPNINFLLGMFDGINTLSTKDWNERLVEITANEKLVDFYPSFVITGKITEQHLRVVIDLAKSGKVAEYQVINLAYGSVLASLEAIVVIEFGAELASINQKFAWVSVDILYMYLHSNPNSITEMRRVLVDILVNVSLAKNSQKGTHDAYHWKDLIEKLFLEKDTDFAISLSNQLISDSKVGFEHNDLWYAIKPALSAMMKNYGKDIWPFFATAIEQAEGTQLYWLQQLLDRENSFSNIQPCILNHLPTTTVIEWCKANKDLGPVFVASCLDILSSNEDKLEVNMLFVELLENFGDDIQVKDSLSANMNTRGWCGSLVPYLESDKAALSPLLSHKSPLVRGWVKEHLAEIDQRIAHESTRDEERNLGMY